MKKDELIKIAMGNDTLKKGLVELQREAETIGLTKAAYAEKLQALFSEAGTELSVEEVESLMTPSEIQPLSSDDLENVAGGCNGHNCYKTNWCNGYNKNCPDCGSYCEVYCS